MDTRERNVGKGFIYVDFVLIWRTAERIDSPQCIPFYLLLCARCVYACVHWVPYGGGVYLLTIAIFASLASSVITSQRALQKKRRLPRNVSPGIHVKRCVRPGGHPSYPVEGRNLRDDDQKDFSNRQEGLIIYFKEKKTEHLETKLFKTTGPENVKKKGEKKI